MNGRASGSNAGIKVALREDGLVVVGVRIVLTKFDELYHAGTMHSSSSFITCITTVAPADELRHPSH